jgi:ankyrin repeat protein
LLVAGADVSLPDGEGKQPLETARQGKNAALVQLLEQHYDAERAVRMEKDRQTHEQLKAKAAAIAQARQQARKEEADALWKTQQEAEATAKTAKEEGMTLKYGKDAANAFVQATLGKDNEAAMVLLDRMEDVNAYVTEYQSTPLLAAIQMEEALLTGALLERGADAVLQPQGSPHSPLTLAVAKGAHKVVRLMAARQPDAVKASLNAPDHELSPLLLAYGDPRMFDALLEAGAQVHFGGNGAPSPVMKAIEKGPVAIVPVLVKHHVDLKAPVAGKSLLDWAIHYGRSDWQGALVHELNRQLEA